MAIFEIQGPDGQVYEIDAPDAQSAATAFQGFVSDNAPGRLPAERPQSQQIMDQYDRAVAAGDIDAAKQLLTDASYAATQDGSAPESVAFNPANGQMEDMALRPDKGRIEAIIQGLGQGVTFGGMDEAVGFGHGLIGPGTFSQNRDYALASMRQDLGSARDNYPISAYGSELAGGIASSVATGNALGLGGATTTAGRAVQGAQVGAAEGALYGALTGEGLQDRALGAAEGGLLGGVVGAATPYAIAGARQAVDPISGVLSSIRGGTNPTRASRAVNEAVRRSGRTPEQIQQAITEAHGAGQLGYSIADAAGYSGQRMLAGATRTPGEARQGIVDFLSSRQQGQGRRLGAALDESLNTPRDTGGLPVPYGQRGPTDFAGMTADQATESMTARRGATASRLYGEARDGAGPVDVRGVLASLDDRLGPMSGVDIKGDGIDAAFSQIRRRLAAEDLPEGVTSIEMSDFNRVLGVKQDVQDMIGAAQRAGQNNRVRELSGVVGKLDEALEASSAGYRSANDEFARASRVIDQVDAGKAATGPRARTADVQAAYAGMTPEQQAAFRVGYSDPVLAKIEGAAPGVNKARFLTDDASQAEIGMMAKDKQAITDFLRREDEMFRTSQAASGGSMTADNIADATDLSGLDSNVIANFLKGNWKTAAGQVGQKAIDSVQGRNTATREMIAQLLLSGDVAKALAPATAKRAKQVTSSKAAEQIIRALERTLDPLR